MRPQHRWLLVVIGFALFIVASEIPLTVSSSVVVAPEVATDARAALARRDWSTAAPLFRLALTRDPGDVKLHYGLAVCATHLNAHEEATRVFRWVLEHAPAASEEARTARSWLQKTRGPGAAADDPTIGAAAPSRTLI